MDPGSDDENEYYNEHGHEQEHNYNYHDEPGFLEMPFDCPVCSEVVTVQNIFHHIAIEHPNYMVTWAAFAMPHLSAHEITNWIMQQYVQQQEEDYINSYEYLTELCETIGNHYVGVENVEDVTQIAVCDKDDSCPICLESIKEAIYCRKINICKHLFCGACIEKWLEEHKTCPICKKDVTEETQMLSTSKSSEEELSPDAAAPASASSPDPLSTNMT